MSDSPSVQLGRLHWIDRSARRSPGFPYRFERPEDVPEPLALGLLASRADGFTHESRLLCWLVTWLSGAAGARAEALSLPRELRHAVVARAPARWGLLPGARAWVSLRGWMQGHGCAPREPGTRPPWR